MPDKALAARVDVLARITPDRKLRIVKVRQARGRTVGCPGDGISDAPQRQSKEKAMTERMQELARNIVALQAELDHEIERRRRARGFSIRDGLVAFEHGVADAQRQHRVGVMRQFAGTPMRVLLTAPVIYGMIVPLMLLDLGLAIYQAVCFPAYGIARVQRRDYLPRDRQQLAYLNWLEAINCGYCTYANGLIAYAREIGARTEQYWCPIKHALRVTDPHIRYYEFLEYGDAEGYRARLADFRRHLAAEAGDSSDS